MKAADVEMLVLSTSACIVITGFVMAIAWPLAGAWTQVKKAAQPTRLATVRCVGVWYIMSVLCFAIVPTVIESYGNTYPVSEATLGYFCFLGAALLLLLVYYAQRYRQQPSQESAFIIILGIVAIGLAVLVVFGFMAAIAASAWTDRKSVV